MSGSVRRQQQGRSTDVDLAGGFRLDLKTGVLLVALLAQWWDGRSQAREMAKIQEMRQTAYEEDQKDAKEQVKALKAQVELLRHDFNEMNLQLARDGGLGTKGKGDR